jgi:hypothetical protein
MNTLDDQALKAEIDEIAKRIDHIIKNVNQFHPVEPEELPAIAREQTLLE